MHLATTGNISHRRAFLSSVHNLRPLTHLPKAAHHSMLTYVASMGQAKVDEPMLAFREAEAAPCATDGA